jgi:predicted Zn-dependent protease
MRKTVLILAVWCLFAPAAAEAQLKGLGGLINKGNDTKAKVDATVKDLTVDEQDEIVIGQQVSEKIRAKYGVAQDPEVHKYVALVGSVLARKSSRPGLPWQFIVLDTDGVNALAAPGGYIHITRGALALMKSEAELAGVLGHEIAHVTRKHTIKAIEKDKSIQTGLTKSNTSAKLKDSPELLQRVVDKVYEGVFAGFGRAEELESDADGPVIAVQAGYAPTGLPQFLRALELRNKDSDQKQGLFASHPEMAERLEKLDAAVAALKDSGAAATLESRYTSHVQYQPVPIGALSVNESAATPAAANTEPKPEEKKSSSSRFSLGRLKNPLAGGDSSKQSGSVTGSAGSRGVDRERLAKGGSNPSPVAVTLSDVEIAAFIAEGKLKT